MKNLDEEKKVKTSLRKKYYTHEERQCEKSLNIIIKKTM